MASNFQMCIILAAAVTGITVLILMFFTDKPREVKASLSIPDPEESPLTSDEGLVEENDPSFHLE
jgi:hypothetical protein